MRVQRGYYDVFIRTCGKYPSKTAVIHYVDGIYKSYTYSELYGLCEYLTQNLKQLKCNKGAIGLISERNIAIPCLIAAAHKCCTTFMFIDPSQNIEVVSNAVTFTIIVTIKNNENKVSSELLGKKPDKTVSVFDLVIDFYCCNMPANRDNRHVNQHSFIATTSGSTGEPKHIQVPIQCIQPNIDDLTKMFKITHEDIIYFSTPLTFDPSMVEILLACINGASLLIAPEKADVLFPLNLRNSITVWQTTPSKFFRFSNFDIKNKILSANSTLRILALGGEPLNGVKRLKELKDCDNRTQIFTLYGVTEMSCWACAAELDLNKILNDQEVPLGSCLSETEVVIEPAKGHNISGKIILASKTRQCFLLNKSKGLKEENFLKFVDTGDYGEINNGTVYYRGRKDDTIKRFGHKVHLQLIESTVMQCPRVKTCSCIWLPKPLLLVVYFSAETLNSQELSDFLKCKLDDKHWPDKVIRVDNLPTNSHGKISKLLVSSMFEKSFGKSQNLDIMTLKLNFLKELKLALGGNFTYEQVKDKHFFSIGGTSFHAVSMCNRLSLICPQFGKFILPYLMSQVHTIEEIMLIVHKEICLEETKSKKRTKRSISHPESDCSPKKANNEKLSCNPVEFIVLWAYDTGKWSLLGLITVESRVQATVLCYRDGAKPRGIVGAYNGTVMCFTLDEGTECWRINIGSMIKSKAAYCNKLVYIASYDGNVRCIDIATGAIKATLHITDEGISADLVVAKKEYILLGTLSGVIASIHARSNTVAWRGTLSSPVFACPAVYDDDKYVVIAEVNGAIHCRTIWKYQGTKGNIFSSLYIKQVDKQKWQMVFGCHDSNVYSIIIKNHQPSLHWKAALTSPVYSTPCGFGDRFILAASNNGKLCVIESESGVIVTENSLPGETFSSPTVYGDSIFIGCRDDHVYSLKYTEPLESKIKIK
ncbi:putative AMP dependent ligase [Operophtera brumata]|uniref:Putative AMP dependent ligase n=1 Tax=Operophtera brumata TaxID=104452 RepID=A0A0L7KQP4_OPEBR|nr:putative AMP dependent ligase [Operophtera brumata]